jgi:hypothetical protein
MSAKNDEISNDKVIDSTIKPKKHKLPPEPSEIILNKLNENVEIKVDHELNTTSNDDKEGTLNKIAESKQNQDNNEEDVSAPKKPKTSDTLPSKDDLLDSTLSPHTLRINKASTSKISSVR